MHAEQLSADVTSVYWLGESTRLVTSDPMFLKVVRLTMTQYTRMNIPLLG